MERHGIRYENFEVFAPPTHTHTHAVRERERSTFMEMQFSDTSKMKILGSINLLLS